MTNRLYYGDNLDVLRTHIADESVDLIYLDPPFNSSATYNILFKSPTGSGADASIAAFEDTWHWNDAAELAFTQVARSGPVPPELRRRLATASGQVAAQRESLARATAALDRAIEVLMPREAPGLYSSLGAADRGFRGGVVQA